MLRELSLFDPRHISNSARQRELEIRHTSSDLKFPRVCQNFHFMNSTWFFPCRCLDREKFVVEDSHTLNCNRNAEYYMRCCNDADFCNERTSNDTAEIQNIINRKRNLGKGTGDMFSVKLGSRLHPCPPWLSNINFRWEKHTT